MYADKTQGMMNISRLFYMVTSSNGNIFRVTDLLCGEFPSQKPVTRSFDIYFDLHLNQQISKQWISWWFDSPSRSLWRDCNVFHMMHIIICVTKSYMQEICLKHYFQWTMSCTSWKLKSNIPWRHRTCDDNIYRYHQQCVNMYLPLGITPF